jgi:exopolysaccharide biosynthesis polyprenyl glycosylphosphotransferase
MQARASAALRRLHLVLDAATVVTAIAAAGALHPWLRGWVPSLRPATDFHEHALLVYLALPLWLGLVVVFGLHRSFERPWDQAGLLSRLLQLHGAGFVGLAVIQFTTQAVINRSLVALFLACAFSLMWGVRTALSAWARLQYREGRAQPRLLLVGEPSARMAAFVNHATATDLPPRILGYLGPETGAASAGAGAPEIPARLGAVDEIERILHADAIDRVMFFPPHDRPEGVASALGACETLGVAASFAVDLTRLASSVPSITDVYDHPFVTYEVSVRDAGALAVKHAIDWVLALVLVVAFAPVMVLAAVAILLSMGAPVLFVQERAGVQGRPFRMLKFRSMAVDAERAQATLRDANEMSGPVFKIADDPRVTRVGRLLRRSSIDELPQLFNVLAGSMSLVGPRPLPLAEQAQIRGWQRRRLSVRPGITGLWQVSGRSNVDFEDWMVLDLRYIDDWSLGLDLWILLKTIPTVLGGRGGH